MGGSVSQYNNAHHSNPSVVGCQYDGCEESVVAYGEAHRVWSTRYFLPFVKGRGKDEGHELDHNAGSTRRYPFSDFPLNRRCNDATKARLPKTLRLLRPPY